MKRPPQPIYFTPIDACSDPNSGYCQLVDISDAPKFRLSKLCDEELLGTLEKLPCEDYEVISDMSSVFTDLTGMVADDSRVESDGIAGTHSAKTAAGYFTVNTMYVISYQLRGLTSGFGSAKIKVGDNFGATRTVNGYYTDTLYSGATDKFELVGTDIGEFIFNGYFTNITVQCIRYSQIFDFEPVGGGAVSDYVTFMGQTKFCITPGVGVQIYKELPDITPGKTYKLTFRITGNTSVATLGYELWPSGASPIASVDTNGYYELYITAGDGTGGGAPGDAEYLWLSLSDIFNGCVQDIQLYEVAENRVGVYNSDGTINECADVTIYEGEDAPLDSDVITLVTNDTACGCVKIGYADSCEDYHGQFTGSNLLPDSTEVFDGVDPDSGEFFITDTAGNEVSVSMDYQGMVDAGYIYCGEISFSATDGGIIPGSALPIDYIRIDVVIGGTLHNLCNYPNPTNTTVYTCTLIDLLSGSTTLDIEFIISWTATGDATGTVDLDTITTSLCSGQLIPRYWSNCFNIIDKSICDDVMIVKYTNDKPLYGLSYDVALPYYLFRIEAKIWHPTFPKTREINRSSTGHKTINYADIDKHYIMNIKPLPPYLIEAIVAAIDHDTLEIGSDINNLIEYVSESDEIDPTWNKNSNLAPIELSLTEQDKRLVKSYC